MSSSIPLSLGVKETPEFQCRRPTRLRMLNRIERIYSYNIRVGYEYLPLPTQLVIKKFIQGRDLLRENLSKVR